MARSDEDVFDDADDDVDWNLTSMSDENDTSSADADADVLLEMSASASSSIAFDDKRDEQLAAYEIGILGVIFFAAIVGNSFVLVALWRQIHFRPRSRMYLFMLHLSIADLLVALFSVLPQMIWKITFRFKGGDLMCRSVKYMQVMVLYLSTYILVMMAVDRYRAICWTPSSWHQWNSLRVAKCLVVAAWIISLLFAVPQALLFSIVELSPSVNGTGTLPSSSGAAAAATVSREAEGHLRTVADAQAGGGGGGAIRDCWAVFEEPWSARIYVTWFVASAFVVPLIVLIYCYGVITFTIWTYENGFNASTMIGTKMESINRRAPTARCRMITQISYAKMKSIRLTFVVVLCFLVCWSPFCVTQLVMAYNPSNKAGPVETIFALLACLNSCTNPWIYLAFGGTLLNHLRVCIGVGTRRARDNGSIGDDEPDPVATSPAAAAVTIFNGQPKPKNSQRI